MPKHTDYYVYVLFRENGCPFYVGKGCGDRIAQHTYRAVAGRSHKDNIICQMLAEGKKVPSAKLAEGLTNDEAGRLEISIISSIGRVPHGPLVNITPGGDGCKEHSKEGLERLRAANLGKKLTPEHKSKMRAAHIGKKRTAEACANISKGKIGHLVSEETRLKISATLTGRKATKETCQKISNALSGRTPSQATVERMGELWRGKKLSHEHVEKLRDAAIKRWASPEERLAQSIRKLRNAS